MEKKVAKIIFLDFDGVLNTEYHQRQLQFEGKNGKTSTVPALIPKP